MQASLLKRKPEILFATLALLGLAVLAGLYAANTAYVNGNPGGSDFLPRWMAMRKYLMEGISPYSEETMREVQQAFYGRTARPGEDQVGFIYPLYSIFVFGPLALIQDFNTARAVWMTILEVCVVLLAGASLALSRWRPPPLAMGLLLLFASLWYYTIHPLLNANASILVALLTALAILAVRWEHDALAGVLLAMASIKPNVVVLLVIFFLVWSASNRRFVLFWSTLGNIALFAAITGLLIPNWIWQNLVQLVAFPEAALPNTPGEIFTAWMPGIGERVGWGFTVLVITTIIWEWRQALGKESRWFLWTAYLTLALTQWVGIPTSPENFIVLLPAVILVFTAWDEQWGAIGRALIIVSVILLFFGLWWLFLSTADLTNIPIQSTLLFFPLPAFLLIGLYWVRWWVLRPEQPLMDRWRRFRRTT